MSSERSERRVEMAEIGDLMREARRLMDQDGTEEEWAGYRVRKQDLMDRITAHEARADGGELR